MRYAICNETYGDWPLARACDHAAACGYEGLEVAPFTLAAGPEQLSAGRREEIRRTIEAAGLTCIGLHWLLAKTTGFQVTSEDAAVRRRTAGRLADLAPEISIEEPQESPARVPPGAPVTLRVRALDPDFGLARVGIETRRIHRRHIRDFLCQSPIQDQHLSKTSHHVAIRELCCPEIVVKNVLILTFGEPIHGRAYCQVKAAPILNYSHRQYRQLVPHHRDFSLSIGSISNEWIWGFRSSETHFKLCCGRKTTIR
jgi:hypothetical protein